MTKRQITIFIIGLLVIIGAFILSNRSQAAYKLNPFTQKFDYYESGTNPMTSTGDMIYGGTSGAATRLASSTAGKVLWINSSGYPVWTATSTLGLGGSSGTVSSVDMSVPTGLSISGNPITSAGTLALTFTGGYSIPKTASTTEGSTAYTWGNHASAGYLLTTNAFTQAIASTTFADKNLYVANSAYYATTTHKNISSLPALVITKSQVSDFGSYENPLTFSWPLIRATNALSFGGLSTSTAAVIGNIPYFSGVNTFANVATGTISASLPISVTAGRSAIGGAAAFTIADAVANSSTKGAATFTTNDFNDSSGNISLDYANGQAATTAQHGFLTDTDWNTFSGKENVLTFGYPLSRSTNAISLLNMATSTITCTGTTSCGAGSFVIGSPLTITGSAGGGTGGAIATSSTLTAGLLLQSTAWNTIANIATNTLNIDLANTVGTLAVNRGGTGLTSGYNNSNWDTAFGWGNHASGGYITQLKVSTSSIPTIGNLAYWTGNGTPSTLGTVATTSLTASTPLALSQAISVIGGTASALTCTTAASGVAGCLSNTAFDTFNNKADTSSAMTGTFDGVDFGNGTLAQNALWLGGAAAIPSELALGTAGYILASSGGTLAYIATTTIPLGGDVTGTLSASVVGNDSHDHNATTISGLSQADFTSANISQWTNDSGYWNLASSTIPVNKGGTGSTTLSGILKGAGTSQVATAVRGTDYTLTTAQSCTNQVITALTAVGGSTCSSVSNAMLSNSTISGVALGSNLAALTNDATLNGSSYNGSSAISDWGLNLANPNTWTALQTFGNATSTLFSSSYASSTLAYFGTAYIPNLGTAAGSFLAVNASGQIIATTTPTSGASASDSTWTLHNSYPAACGAGDYVTAIGDTLTCGTPSGSGTVGASTKIGQVPYYASVGTTLTATSSIFITSTEVQIGSSTVGNFIVDPNIKTGLGTSTPYSTLTVWGMGTGTGQNFQIVNNASTTLMTVLDNGLITLGTTAVFNAGSASRLTLPNGAAMFTNNTGDIVVDTTSGQLRYNNGTATSTLTGFYTMVAYYATSTSWTGTTTLLLAPAMAALTVDSVYCESPTGTVGTSLYDGTNRANYIPTASSTINKFTYSTNNAFTAGESIRVDFGTPATSPTKVSCRFKILYTAD